MSYTERAYGIRYGTMEGNFMPSADIAKLMRTDIRLEIAAGDLPGKASNYSVRVHNYSGGRSIRITARDLPDMWRTCDDVCCRDMWCAARNDPRYAAHARTHRTLTDHGARVLGILQAIHNAYNHNGSDVMTDYFDVNYYGSAEVETEQSAEWRAAETARQKARKARKAGAQ